MDSLPDVYEVTVEAQVVIPVERILEIVVGFKDREIWQEDLTQEMARRLGAKVTSVGHHSGVRTEVVV
jgi:hypothetical protein